MMKMQVNKIWPVPISISGIYRNTLSVSEYSPTEVYSSKYPNKQGGYFVVLHEKMLDLKTSTHIKERKKKIFYFFHYLFLSGGYLWRGMPLLPNKWSLYINKVRK